MNSEANTKNNDWKKPTKHMNIFYQREDKFFLFFGWKFLKKH